MDHNQSIISIEAMQKSCFSRFHLCEKPEAKCRLLCQESSGSFTHTIDKFIVCLSHKHQKHQHLVFYSLSHSHLHPEPKMHHSLRRICGPTFTKRFMQSFSLNTPAAASTTTLPKNISNATEFLISKNNESMNRININYEESLLQKAEGVKISEAQKYLMSCYGEVKEQASRREPGKIPDINFNITSEFKNQYDVSAMVVLCHPVFLMQFLEQLIPKLNKDEAREIMTVAMARSFVKANKKMKIATTWPQYVNRYALEDLITALHKDYQKRAPPVLEVFDKIVGIGFPWKTVKVKVEPDVVDAKSKKQNSDTFKAIKEELKSIISKPLDSQPASADLEALEKSTAGDIIPTVKTLHYLLLRLSLEHEKRVGLYLFHKYFFSTPDFEKSDATKDFMELVVKLYRSYSHKDREPVRQLFTRYMDESHRYTDHYIPPIDKAVRDAAKMYPSPLAQLIFQWKYSAALKDQKVIDYLSIQKRKLAYQNRLERVFEMVQQPFDAAKAEALEKQFEEEDKQELQAKKSASGKEKKQKEAEKDSNEESEEKEEEEKED